MALGEGMISRKIDAKEKRPTSETLVSPLFHWWAHQDSNLGPMDYESTALTN
jgi:hypothetical protein